jgi:hypothetical protein
VFTAGFIALSAGSTLLAAETPKPQTSKPSENVPSLPTVTDLDLVMKGGDASERLRKTESLPVPDAPVFAAFRLWLDKYKVAPAAQKSAMEGEGIRLATERRAALAELIARDPKHALELSVGVFERRNLPTAVLQQLENVLQGRGDYGIVHSTAIVDIPVPGKPGETQKAYLDGYKRVLSFGGRAYTAYVYGKRRGLLSKTNLPFYGIAVDGVAAIDESPIWVLAPGQNPPADATLFGNDTKCLICGQEAKNEIVGVVGSTIYHFDTVKHLERFKNELWAAEALVGPKQHG